MNRRCCAGSGAFVGGFSLDAAETVCADEHLDPYDVLDVLTRLVDKSLVQLDDTTGRYGLLETVRQYVLDRATAAGELPEIRGRHLAWCLDLAARWGLDRRLPTVAVCEEVDAEYANLLAALDWSLGDEAAVTLLHPLAAVWDFRSRLTDSVVWSDRVLAHLEEGSPPWVRTIAIVARPRTTVGDPHFNIDVMDQALDAAERHDDRWAQTRILSNNPIFRLLVRPDTDMFAQFDRAIELAAADGDEPGELLADRGRRPVGRGRLPPPPRPRLPRPSRWPRPRRLAARLPHRRGRHADRPDVRQLRGRSPSRARSTSIGSPPSTAPSLLSCSGGPHV